MARALVTGILNRRVEQAHMTSTTHHAITDLTVRLLIGALVLGVLILMGVGITQVNWPTAFSVDLPR